MQYRRARVPGACYFFTLVTDKRRPVLTSHNSISVLRNAFKTVHKNHPFKMDAIVVLPDHLHCIWTLPENDKNYPTRWRLIKTWFTRHCDKHLHKPVNASRKKKSQKSIWQHRYWEHLIRNESDYRHHVEYIHYNPVKHGHVSRPADWPHSSFQYFVDRDIYSEDWGSGEIILPEGIGGE